MKRILFVSIMWNTNTHDIKNTKAKANSVWTFLKSKELIQQLSFAVNFEQAFLIVLYMIYTPTERCLEYSEQSVLFWKSWLRNRF